MSRRDYYRHLLQVYLGYRRKRTRLDYLPVRLSAERERESGSSQAAQVQALEGELATLTREREEVRRRISRLVGLLEELD